MSNEERNKRIRKLKAQGLSNVEIAKREGVHHSTVAYIATGTRSENLAKMGLKPLSLPVDFETVAQLDALSKAWSLPRCEVMRIMIDWGLEALPDAEKEICEEAARTCGHGAL
jgi:transposase